jgi:hypothetical protein
VFRATINAPADIQAPVVGAVVGVEVEVKTGKVRLDPHSTMGTLRAVGGMLEAAQQARLQAEYGGALAASGAQGGMGGGPGAGGAGPAGPAGAAAGPMQQALFTAFGQNGRGIAVTAGPELAQLAQQIRSGDPAQRAAALAELRQRAASGGLMPPGMASPGAPGGFGPAAPAGTPGASGPAGAFGEPGPAPSTFDPVSPINTFNGPVSPAGPGSPGGLGSPPGGLGGSFSAGARTDQAERLTRLKALRDQGLLSLVEYETQRQRILNEL